MATIKYRDYNSSSPAFCICVILASWVFVAMLTLGIVHFTAIEALVIFACADAGFLIVSENVKSLPAILWIVCTEIVYNVMSTVFTFLMAVYVLPTSDKGMYAILDAVYNLAEGAVHEHGGP
uniref:MARVEL domain-containing protein n=1 Tax=Panagrellus redivivus TaxID=6233 RepID=A0A7E4V0I1_PANRE